MSTIATVAKHQQKTPAQISLAWLLSQDSSIIPIPGTAKVKHLQDNVDAIDIHLSAGELSEIDAACQQIVLKGKRFPKELADWFVS